MYAIFLTLSFKFFTTHQDFVLHSIESLCRWQIKYCSDPHIHVFQECLSPVDSTLKNILPELFASFPHNHHPYKDQKWDRNESCFKDYHQSSIRNWPTWEFLTKEPHISCIIPREALFFKSCTLLTAPPSGQPIIWAIFDLLPSNYFSFQ